MEEPIYYCQTCKESLEWGVESCPRCNKKIIKGLIPFFMALLLAAGIIIIGILVGVMEKMKIEGGLQAFIVIVFIIFWYGFIMSNRRQAYVIVRLGELQRSIVIPPEDWRGAYSDYRKEQIVRFVRGEKV